MKIKEEDALYIAKEIAKQAVAELKQSNPILMLKTAGITLAEYNASNDDEQNTLLAKSEQVCIENLTDEFNEAILANPKDFLTKHTKLFDEAELEMEEYLIKE